MEVLNTQEEIHKEDGAGIKLGQEGSQGGSKLLQQSSRLPLGAWLFEQAALSYQLSASIRRKMLVE